LRFDYCELGVELKSQIPIHKSQIIYNDQNTKFQTGLNLFCIALQLNTRSYHESTKALKLEQIKQLHFLGLIVSVSDHFDLEFICYLVLEIWNLLLAGSLC
jgi:hypothetical protein